MIAAQVRLISCVSLFLVGFHPIFASSTPGRPGRIFFLGSEYVNLQEWARSQGFQAQWTVWKDEVKITSAYSTLIFNVDSRRAIVNGVSVWLSTAIAFRNGAYESGRGGVEDSGTSNSTADTPASTCVRNGTRVSRSNASMRTLPPRTSA